MGAIGYRFENYGYEEFLEHLDLTSDIFNILKRGSGLYLINLPIALYEIHKACRMSHRLVENIRSAVSSYSSDHIRECYDSIKEIRDKYISISDRISDSKLLSFCFMDRVENMLDEWDELAEDCYIASDNEIKELIEKIAEHV